MIFPQPCDLECQMTQALEHTGSYYAATVNQVTDYAPLAGDHTADVCVIGAGFTGVSTALHLAERGYDVRVVEAHRVGWGASGRNGGQLIGGISGEDRIAKQLGASMGHSSSIVQTWGTKSLRGQSSPVSASAASFSTRNGLPPLPKMLSTKSRLLTRLPGAKKRTS